jgi:dienelactone hydrolase
MDRRKFLIVCSGAMVTSGFSGWANAQTVPDTVRFPSLDGTPLVGYLFKPARPNSVRAPALVLLHGRAGAYSLSASGRYDATTLSQRHLLWGTHWAERGAFALLVDTFGPRGFPAGFGRGSHAERPPQVSEVTVRPLDAYGGLKFLSGLKEVDAARIGLQGWSNGGSATLATMAISTLRSVGLNANEAFRAALAFYPACGLDNRFRGGLSVYAPVRVLMGTADEEVSPKRCAELVKASQRAGDDITLTIYPDATHDFDDPGRKRQGVAANAAAFADATIASDTFMTGYLRL